jgi:hypothetical protein
MEDENGGKKNNNVINKKSITNISKDKNDNLHNISN